MDWSFFEMAHCEGAVDGVGGTVQRTVWLAVLRNKVVAAEAQTFAKVGAQLCKDIRVCLFVSDKTINKLT